MHLDNKRLQSCKNTYVCMHVCMYLLIEHAYTDIIIDICMYERCPLSLFIRYLMAKLTRQKCLL